MNSEPVYKHIMVGRKMLPPPPKCFSCGTALPEDDFETYHQRAEVEMENPRKVLDEMGYPLGCCRRMFMGDAYEARRAAGLYDYSTLGSSPHL